MNFQHCRGWSRLLAVHTVFLVAAFECDAQVPAIEREASLTITSPRPLGEAVRMLTDLYGTPLTYEEPPWLWPLDRFVAEDCRQFVLPIGLSPGAMPSLEAAARKIIELYNTQSSATATFRGTRFRVERSQYGVHIVPSMLYSPRGGLASAGSILDVYVTVSPGTRLASGHFQAICEAVSSASGVKLELNDPVLSLDSFFAANGIVAPRGAALLPTMERQKYSFDWGSTRTTGRAALLALLQRSATTLTWVMMCEPKTQSKDRHCLLSLLPMRARTIGEGGMVQVGQIAEPPVAVAPPGVLGTAADPRQK